MVERHVNIVGIAGLSRSGKDTLAELFIKDGYFGVSLGDLAREFSRERHVKDEYPISRANLTETSNWLRKTRGADVYMQIALDKYAEALKTNKSLKGLLCWSIRAPIEADFIKRHQGELIWINVSDKVRYARAMNDLRPGEPKLSFEDYLAQEDTQYKPQKGIEESIQMNLPYIKSKATLTLINNSNDIQAFISKAQKIIDKIK